MRAICGAIMTAGALIGLGLTAIGLGHRYAGLGTRTAQDSTAAIVHWRDVDPALLLIIVVLLIMVGIGIAVAFIGLAYHHERRMHERMHLLGRLPGQETGTRPLP